MKGKSPEAEKADDDEVEKVIDVEAVTSLRDFKYQLQVLLQEPAR